MDFYSPFSNFCKSRYPIFAEVFPSQETLQVFVSPLVVRLPKSFYDEAEACLSAIYRARKNEAPQLFDPGNESAFISFDFYATDDGMRLIEINTNAVGSLLTALLSEYHGLGSAQSHFLDMRHMFQTELKLSGQKTPPKNVAIVDDAPETQKTAFDFYLHKALFESWGWPTRIVDPAALTPDISLIYNRSTDFFLTSPQWQATRNAYLSKQVCITPNPHEYALLADKSRLIYFSSLNSPCLPQVLAVDSVPSDELWERRRKLFFKPKHSYGGKAAYKGDGISRKVFEHVLQGNYVAQPYFTAKTIEDFKYDVRFFVYRGNIQLVAARLFKGQLTNFKTPGGGFAPVSFS